MSDTLLIRAPVGVVYRTLTDLDGWPRWRAGCTSVRVTPDREGDRSILVLPDGARRWRLDVHVHGWRHDLGARWRVRGAVVLDAEWWLEQRPEGTLIHHLVDSTMTGRRAARRVRRHRRVMMVTLQAMKDHLELAVAIAAGRTS